MVKRILIIASLISPVQAGQVNSYNRAYQQNITASRSNIGQIGNNYNYNQAPSPFYVQPQMPGYANFHDRAFCEPNCLVDREHRIGY